MNFYILTAIVIAITVIFLLIALLPRGTYTDRDGAKGPLQILVLGDIGRSPRMQNHAISALKHGIPVNLIGYLDSELHPRLDGHELLTVYPLENLPEFLSKSKAPFVVIGPLKVLWQLFQLWAILGLGTAPAKWLLVQNPPSIPTLLVASIICWFRKTRLAIDWHNFGYTILALKLGDQHPLVKVSHAYEKWFSRYADVNFTVSEAMSRRMKRDFKLSAPVLRLYDRPTEDFEPLDEPQRRETMIAMQGIFTMGKTSPYTNNKLRVLVSSTSWTPDEDFSILLDALVEYSRMATSTHSQLSPLMVVITGKGPQKEMYLKKIEELQKSGKLAVVTITTAWLPTKDYASLLACADLGVSLHQSSSGVDLPMKVVDMFGAGLPVVGWSKFESWPELVKDGVNGMDFGSMEELRDRLVELFGDDGTRLALLRDNVLKEGKDNWQSQWDSTVGRTFQYLK